MRKRRFNRLIPVFICCLVFTYGPEAVAIEAERLEEYRLQEKKERS